MTYSSLNLGQVISHHAIVICCTKSAISTVTSVVQQLGSQTIDSTSIKGGVRSCLYKPSGLTNNKEKSLLFVLEESYVPNRYERERSTTQRQQRKEVLWLHTLCAYTQPSLGRRPNRLLGPLRSGCDGFFIKYYDSLPTQNTEFCIYLWALISHHQMVLRHFEELYPILREISRQKGYRGPNIGTTFVHCWYRLKIHKNRKFLKD